MGKVIGKVIATEKNPSTIDNFYFWTNTDMILNPFDVVKVPHIQNSVTYGVIEEISHITDTVNFLADYISNDFGDVTATENTHRVGMNYVKASVVGNSKNIYIPLTNNSQVEFADKNEVAEALGLTDENVKSPVICGYLEMYSGSSDEDKVFLPVKMDSRFLIGPEGAHLNISGISGLAAKTSYAMFLLKAIQDKYLANNIEDSDDSIAFVLFNVKGKDLLSIDEPAEFETAEKRKEVISLYEKLGLNTTPFKNVKYYYPYAKGKTGNTYLPKDTLDNQLNSNAKLFKYSFEDDKESLDLMFANMDDPNFTMDSIITTITNGDGNFADIADWSELLTEVKNCSTAQYKENKNKEISVASWKKFYRILKKEIDKKEMFDKIIDKQHEVRLGDALKHIEKNEVHVIDIAKLPENLQGYVFGDVMRTIHNLQLNQYDDENLNPPKKIVIFIDELNKYASGEVPKTSPILRQILDITERGRSLGIILFSAEQFKSAIHERVKGNCSTHAYGRTNAIEIAKNDYKFVPPVYKNMMTRLKQGEYIVQNPIFRSLLNIKFPEPIYKQYKQ